MAAMEVRAIDHETTTHQFYGGGNAVKRILKEEGIDPNEPIAVMAVDRGRKHMHFVGERIASRLLSTRNHNAKRYATMMGGRYSRLYEFVGYHDERKIYLNRAWDNKDAIAKILSKYAVRAIRPESLEKDVDSVLTQMRRGIQLKRSTSVIASRLLNEVSRWIPSEVMEKGEIQMPRTDAHEELITYLASLQ